MDEDCSIEGGVEVNPYEICGFAFWTKIDIDAGELFHELFPALA